VVTIVTGQSRYETEDTTFGPRRHSSNTPGFVQHGILRGYSTSLVVLGRTGFVPCVPLGMPAIQGSLEVAQTGAHASSDLGQAGRTEQNQHDQSNQQDLAGAKRHRAEVSLSPERCAGQRAVTEVDRDHTLRDVSAGHDSI
jgi:hypothetical protein